MNLEWKKKFVELVKAGAPLRAYQKKLGLDKAGLQHHLGNLAEYEAALEPKKVEPPKVKQQMTSIDRVKKFVNFNEAKKKIIDRLDDKIVEDKKEVKDEEDNTT